VIIRNLSLDECSRQNAAAISKSTQALDKAVDLCYRPQPFINETKRIEFLFELYDKITSGMFGKEKKKKKNI
jgi:hypothetical protein